MSADVVVKYVSVLLCLACCALVVVYWTMVLETVVDTGIRMRGRNVNFQDVARVPMGPEKSRNSYLDFSGTEKS